MLRHVNCGLDPVEIAWGPFANHDRSRFYPKTNHQEHQQQARGSQIRIMMAKHSILIDHLELDMIAFYDCVVLKVRDYEICWFRK